MSNSAPFQLHCGCPRAKLGVPQATVLTQGPPVNTLSTSDSRGPFEPDPFTRVRLQAGQVCAKPLSHAWPGSVPHRVQTAAHRQSSREPLHVWALSLGSFPKNFLAGIHTALTSLPRSSCPMPLHSWRLWIHARLWVVCWEGAASLSSPGIPLWSIKQQCHPVEG